MNLLVSCNETPDFIVIVLTSFMLTSIWVIVVGHDTMVFAHFPTTIHPAASTTTHLVIFIEYTVTTL